MPAVLVESPPLSDLTPTEVSAEVGHADLWRLPRSVHRRSAAGLAPRSRRLPLGRTVFAVDHAHRFT